MYLLTKVVCMFYFVLFVMMRSPKPQHTLALRIIEKPSISKSAPIWFGSVYIYSARMIEY